MTKDMGLLSRLAELERLLHREQGRMHREGRPFADMSRGQGRILAMLRLKDGISTKDLSYLLGIRVSSLNETLAKMEKSGYISRKPSPKDKRVSMIYVTEKGRNESFEPMEETTVFDCFSDEEKDIFGDYLDRLITSLGSRETEDAKENDEKWAEMMKERMGEEWFEHVMAIRGTMGGMDRQRRAPRRPRRPGPAFGDRAGDEE